ncbi:hypothetical protein ACOCJ7_08355 [Knoellia sp. CPCC 206453]|uniref:hypothetical protein n=1 Tax=Knoellia pratensis TaxID=3404796 RepID=UPI00361637A3
MTQDLQLAQPLWRACNNVDEFLREANAHVLGAPVPVLTEDRADLLESLTAAQDLYELDSTVPRSGTAVVLGLDGEVRTAVEALLAKRVEVLRDSIEAYAVEPVGDLIVVAPYPQLDHGILDRARVTAQATGATARLITGRDAASLTWLLAKQMVRRRDTLVRSAVVSGTANLPLDQGDVVVIGSRDVETEPVDQLLLGQAWRQVVFHGHGTEDSINLGEFTVCGRNDAVADVAATTVRPKCGYGLGCYKSDDTLISLARLRASHVVMASCCNATFAPNRLYGAKYLLLLNGIDGVAQSLLVSPMVHDADHAELASWLPAMRRQELVASGPAMSDIHPFTPFVNIGLPPTPGEPVAPTTLDLPDTTRVSELSTTVQGLLSSGLLSASHPMHKGLLALARKIESEMARGVRGTADRWAEFTTSLRADVQSLDLRIAKGIARDPEDPILDFPQYFGDRSEVDPDTVADVTCMCGLEAVEWKRRPLLGHLLVTTAMVCPRCGDVRFSTPGAPDVSVTMPTDLTAGDAIPGQLTLSSPTDRVVHVGMFVPRYMREAYPTPAPIKVKIRGGESATVELVLAAHEDVTPQAYYATAYAVSDLSLVTVRQRFAIHPRGGTP